MSYKFKGGHWSERQRSSEVTEGELEREEKDEEELGFHWLYVWAAPYGSH